MATETIEERTLDCNPYSWATINAGTGDITNTTKIANNYIIYVTGIVNTSQKNTNYKIGKTNVEYQNLPYKLPVYLEISADTDISSYDFAVNGNEIIIYNSDSSSHTVIFDGTTTETVLANNFIRERYEDDWLNVYSGYTYNGVLEIPIGGQYIQVASVASNTITVACPTSESPASLYGGTWTELWDTESIYLRTEGTLADANRTLGKQEDAMQRITGLHWVHGDSGSVASGVFTVDRDIVFSAWGQGSGDTDRINFDNANSTSPNPAKTNDDETRVVNRLMIIWIRTA